MQIYVNQSLVEYHRTTVDGANETATRPGESVDDGGILLEYAFPIPLSVYRIPMYFIAVIGIPANAVLLYYLFRSGKYRTPTFCTITSLAMADFITCSGNSLTLLFLFPEMPHYVPGCICPMLLFTVTTAMSVSSYHLLLFSAIRFYQLIYPLRSNANLTLKLITMFCVSIWMLAAAGNLPFLWLMKAGYVLDRPNVMRVCDFYGNYQLRDIMFHITLYIFPIITMITLHIIKFIRINKSSDKQITKQSRLGTVHKAMYMMIIFFFISWIPSFIHDMVHEVFGVSYAPNHMLLYHITNFILVINNCANPYIYMLIAKPIREDILNYTCRLTPCYRKRPS